MKIIKQISIKIAWLIIYLVFNIGLFFIETSIFFTREFASSDSNTGYEILDALIDVGSSVSNIFSAFAFMMYGYITIAIVLKAFLIFIPVYLKSIKGKYQNKKKQFLYSLLASFAIVMSFKAILYVFMIIFFLI